MGLRGLSTARPEGRLYARSNGRGGVGLRRCSRSVSPELCTATFAASTLRSKPKAKLTEVTLDTDTTVHTLYGSQMGGRVSYNPKNKGRKSYQPMLTFVAETREFAGGAQDAEAGGGVAGGNIETVKKTTTRGRRRIQRESGR